MGQLKYAADRGVAIEQARTRADEALRRKYGTHYTGTPAEQTVKPAEQPPVATDNRLLAQAKRQIEWSQNASLEQLQDYLQLNATTAEDLLSQLETQGVVSAPDARGNRQVLTGEKTAQAAPRTVEEEADARAEAYVPTEAEAFPAEPEAQPLPRNVVPFMRIPPRSLRL